MKKKTIHHVKKRTLLAIAGCVWLVAGFNVARLGVLAYIELGGVKPTQALLSLLVFAAFGAMFFKMSMKHTKRIKGYREEFRPVWNFFDLKGYIIMAVMMSGGIGLRSAGLVPVPFVAVFYTGLGSALGLAGLLFWLMFALYKKHDSGTAK